MITEPVPAPSQDTPSPRRRAYPRDLYLTCVADAVLDAILSDKDAAAHALEEALRSRALRSRALPRRCSPPELAAFATDCTTPSCAVLLNRRRKKTSEVLRIPMLLASSKLHLIDGFRIKATMWDFAAIVPHQPGSGIRQIHT
jgi:hypothetical protein